MQLPAVDSGPEPRGQSLWKERQGAGREGGATQAQAPLAEKRTLWCGFWLKRIIPAQTQPVCLSPAPKSLKGQGGVSHF